MKNVTRRRFISISAATGMQTIVPGALSLASSKPLQWNGIVMGAEASITIHGENAKLALEEALLEIRKFEKQLSIYDPKSDLSRLNVSGHLQNTSGADFALAVLVEKSKVIHQDTHGLFDPTVQPLFEAYAKASGKPSEIDLSRAKSLVGMDKVSAIVGRQVSFATAGMAMTFNGIAQGFITDQVRRVLNRHGFKQSLVNIGEYSIGDKQANIGVADAQGNVFDVARLQNQAIATSSPAGFSFPDGTSHILHPDGHKHEAYWDTVSVVAKNATTADGYSTALALTQDAHLAEQLVANGVLQKVILKNMNGETLHI